MGKFLFLHFIRDAQGRKKRVNNGYLCRMLKNGKERTSVINIQPLINAGVLDRHDFEDEDVDPPQGATDPVAGPSQQGIELESSIDTLDSLDGPLGLGDTDDESEDEVPEREIGPRVAFVRYGDKAGTKRKRSGDGPEEEDQNAPGKKVSPKSVLVKAMLDIHKREEACKEKRIKEKLNVLGNIHVLEDEGMERRLKDMLNHLKVAYCRRELRREENHKDDVDRLRKFHKLGERERELRHQKKLDRLMASPNCVGGRFERGQKYSVGLAHAYRETDELDDQQLFLQDFEQYKDEFLNEQ